MALLVLAGTITSLALAHRGGAEPFEIPDQQVRAADRLEGVRAGRDVDVRQNVVEVIEGLVAGDGLACGDRGQAERRAHVGRAEDQVLDAIVAGGDVAQVEQAERGLDLDLDPEPLLEAEVLFDHP